MALDAGAAERAAKIGFSYQPSENVDKPHTFVRKRLLEFGPIYEAMGKVERYIRTRRDYTIYAPQKQGRIECGNALGLVKQTKANQEKEAAMFRLIKATGWDESKARAVIFG